MMDRVVERVDIELVVVPDCPHAPAAQELLRTALDVAGLPGTGVRVSVIESQREAEKRGFVGSPTILINGVDPFAEPGSPSALACRVYPGPGGPSGLPPADRLMKALTHRPRRPCDLRTAPSQ
jgi:hypothetical protein